MYRHWLVGISILLWFGVAASGFAGATHPESLSAEEIVERMEERFQQQLAALEAYQDQRRYSIAHPLLGDGTYWIVEENFSAPDEKRFEVLERGGSGTVQNLHARLPVSTS